MGSTYLNKENDEKIEVSYSPELLKQIFWYKVPKRVLKTNAQIMNVCEENIIHIQFYNSHFKIKLKKQEWFCYLVQ